MGKDGWPSVGSEEQRWEPTAGRQDCRFETMARRKYWSAVPPKIAGLTPGAVGMCLTARARLWLRLPGEPCIWQTKALYSGERGPSHPLAASVSGLLHRDSHRDCVGPT